MFVVKKNYCRKFVRKFHCKKVLNFIVKNIHP